MKKPYIKKFGEISKFTVWIVDGKFIRKNIDEEFTNFGQHYRFKFIPENEFWIDKEGKEGEERYYIDSMLTMNRLLAKGMNHDEAVKKADIIERRERAKSNLMKKEIKLRKDHEKLINSVHKKFLKEYSGKKVKIWIVDGEAVRDLFCIDFTEGGHNFAYPFIPKNEVWIDNDVSKDEIKFILLHELHERNLMEKGWGYAFDKFTQEIIKKTSKNQKIKKSAHFDAARVEYYCRHHPKETDKYMKIEIKRNNR